MSRRGFCVGLGALSLGALRVPQGGALRIPLPAPRTVLDPMQTSELAELWSLSLQHAGIAALTPAGTYTHPLLEAPPARARGAFVLTLREGITASNGTPIDAAAVMRCWSAARGSASGRLALALLAPLNPFEARGARELALRPAFDGALDEFLAAPAMAITVAQGGGRAGIGPFSAGADAPNSLQRNAFCPTGAPYIERVELHAARPRNDELRAFTTGALDASWWGAGLYSETRPAQRVSGAAAAAVGLVPTPGGAFADARVARALERALGSLTGEGGPLRAFPASPRSESGTAALGAAVASRGGPLRLGRAVDDALIGSIAERAVALLDAAHITAMLVSPDDSPDLTLRAVAPMSRDPWISLASLLAASAGRGGDEAGASAIARTPRARREAVSLGVWSRSVIACLGRLTPALFLRADVRGARFDGAQLSLADAWIGG